MILRSLVFLATLLTPATAFAGDGTFGVPPSGILPPPTRTAALSEPDLRPSRAPNKAASVVQLPPAEREPAANAGQSRPVSHEPEEPARPKKKYRKPQARKPVPTVDPAYLARMQADAQPTAPQPLYAPAAQHTGAPRQNYAQPRPAAAAQQTGRAKMSRSGVPCHELRGIFTSPPECG